MTDLPAYLTMAASVAIFVVFTVALWRDHRAHEPKPEAASIDAIVLDMLGRMAADGMYYGAFQAGEVRIWRVNVKCWRISCAGTARMCDNPEQVTEFFVEWWHETKGGVGPRRDAVRTVRRPPV